ncbi:hypothetical protein DL93DRAFT_2168836 [Clavulina sp. PMI_390]|nr:hypothetical protein DL93DRAFT_2168836 [Clavulina sp. PMI_390]
MPGLDSTTDKATQQMAKVAMQVREAMRNTLPTPPEQYFTLNIPGKIINFDDFIPDSDETITPGYIQANEAKLCDDMVPLAGIQLGPTGRSVSSSYDTALDELIPSVAWPGIVDEATGAKLTPEQQRYKKAMEWLRGPADFGAGKTEFTRVGLYKHMLALYTATVDQKTKAYASALEVINQEFAHDSKDKKEKAFNDWVNQNGRRYNDLIQGAYMEFVTIGQKEQVEYWFAIVDNSSAMGRVEASKQAKRNASILDSDGIIDLYKVDLTPSNWAQLAKQGLKPDTSRKTKFEIIRLQKLNALLNALLDKTVADNATKVLPNIGNLNKAVDEQNEAVQSKLSALFEAQHDFGLFEAGQRALVSVLAKFPKETKGLADFQKVWDGIQGTNVSGSTTSTALKDLSKAAEDVSGEEVPKAEFEVFTNAVADIVKGGVAGLQGAQSALATELAKLGSAKMEQLSAGSGVAIAALLSGNKKTLQNQIDLNNEEITRLQNALSSGVNTGQALQNFAGGAGNLGPDVTNPGLDENYFTHITLSVSQYDESSDSSATSVSYGAGASFGLFGGTAGGSHTKSSQDAEDQMAKATVNVDFDVMRVDIGRQWLNSELFYDPDLTTSHAIVVSQGAQKLAPQIQPAAFGEDNKPAPFIDGGSFPAYPTAFLVAANVVLDIQGDSSAITQHFDSTTESVSGSIGWGPFSVSSSYSHTTSHATSKCTSTATGCRIEIGSPQIIGWVSEFVPQLPRPPLKSF